VPIHTWGRNDDGLGLLKRESTLYEGLELLLLDRSWVFQEQLLAPHTIQSVHREMVWECFDTFGIIVHQPNTLVLSRGIWANR
jgi:hypothetical protein